MAGLKSTDVACLIIVLLLVMYILGAAGKGAKNDPMTPRRFVQHAYDPDEWGPPYATADYGVGLEDAPGPMQLLVDTAHTDPQSWAAFEDAARDITSTEQGGMCGAAQNYSDDWAAGNGSSLTADERMAAQSRARADREVRAIVGNSRRMEHADYWVREELEEYESKPWWSRHED